MDAETFAKMLNISVEYLKNQWSKVVGVYAQQGIILRKEGSGNKTKYFISEDAPQPEYSLEEIANIFDYEPDFFRTHFRQIANKHSLDGIWIVRYGKGENATYGVSFDH